MKYPSFIGGSSKAQSPTLALERTINFFVEASESPGAKARTALYPSPGVTLFATLPSTPIRALFAVNDRVFVVAGNAFCEVTEAGTVTRLGTVTLDVGTDPATISGNGDGGEELLITSGDNGYLYSLCSGHFDTVRRGETTTGAMVDGYFLALDAATSTLWCSALLDGSTWDALWFQQRSAAPDPWVGLATLNKDVWLFGEQTSEVWYNAGGVDFPLLPQPGGLVPFGLAAPWSVAQVGNSLMWLSRTTDGAGLVVQASNFLPRIVSTHAFQWALHGYTRIDDAVGWSFQEQGHVFYVLTFPTAQATWVYDLMTNQWAEWATWDPEAAAYTAWRPQWHAYCWDQHLVGDRAGSGLYTLSTTAPYDVTGLPIRRVRRAPVLAYEGQRLFFSRFELDLEVGLGLGVPPGEDPQVTLRYSNDNGKTWAQAGERQAGPQGAYRTRAIWRRLGSGRNRVFEVVMADPIPYRLVDCYLDLTPGGPA